MRDWKIALEEYVDHREAMERLEEIGDCTCDANEFHTCALCKEIGEHDMEARRLMTLWGDTWAMRLRKRSQRKLA